MKKIGIVCDNYKVERFKKMLTKKGLINFTVSDFSQDCKAIQVRVPDDQFESAKNKITAISYEIEAHFKQSN